MKNYRFKNWEAALLLAVCVTLCAGTWAQGKSEALSSALVRLHVVAASDEEREQAVKLRVRDAVLECLAPELEGAETAEEARERIALSIRLVEAAARSAAEGREVAVELGREYYPTRDYEGFSLPAGAYTSLRVTLGQGEGRNWWCVVFPPLCLSAAEAEEAMGALPEGDAAIISGEGEGVEIRFRILELWGELMAWLEGRAQA